MGKVTVKVATPVKTAAQLFMPGPHEVDPETADELAAAGALEIDGADDPPAEAPQAEPAAMTADEIDRLAADRAQVIADTLVGGAVERAVADLVRERDEALARAAEAEARVADLEKEHAAANAPTPAAEAEVAPKKGSKAAKG